MCIAVNLLALHLSEVCKLGVDGQHWEFILIPLSVAIFNGGLTFLHCGCVKASVVRDIGAMIEGFIYAPHIITLSF